MKKQVFLFIMMLMPLVVMSQTRVTINGIKYSLSGGEATVSYEIQENERIYDDNGNYTGTTIIHYYSTYSGDIVIPTKVVYKNVSYSVTSIGQCAFQDCI